MRIRKRVHFPLPIQIHSNDSTKLPKFQPVSGKYLRFFCNFFMSRVTGKQCLCIYTRGKPPISAFAETGGFLCLLGCTPIPQNAQFCAAARFLQNRFFLALPVFPVSVFFKDAVNIRFRRQQLFHFFVCGKLGQFSVRKQFFKLA